MWSKNNLTTDLSSTDEIPIFIMKIIRVQDIFCGTRHLWRAERLESHFILKIWSYQYVNFPCGNNTIARSSYIHNSSSSTGNITSVYIQPPQGDKWSVKVFEFTTNSYFFFTCPSCRHIMVPQQQFVIPEGMLPVQIGVSATEAFQGHDIITITMYASSWDCMPHHFDGWMQSRRNSSALAMSLLHSAINFFLPIRYPSVYFKGHGDKIRNEKYSMNW